ncbi:UPF0454 protein C12orf49 homolog [Temnothorax curvispinosus]|uniref:SREBP regulating gene protein n=1 Tax=Temnothorax curvispinosus TaxID=300111 RepID=A0A6J1PVW2_9HYME|nr:UPF0454 protein C12orf49 homolog [Temnothorax curvispinosus]
MSSCTSLIRLLRRRLVLGLIFALSLTYCAFSLLRNEKKGPPNLDNDLDMDPMMINDNNKLIPDDNTLEELRASDKSPLWQVEILDQAANDNTEDMDASNLNDSDVSAQTCRNSIQGRGLIVDDRGVVCLRHEVLSNGCCTIEQIQTSKNEESLSMARRERYSCKTCNPQGCCTIYEYCVSCCLHPDKQIKSRKDVLSNSAKVQKDVGRMPIRNSDRFQICLAACRTSSSSVRHENTYKDPLAKHCFITQRYRRNINSLNNNGDNPAVVVTSSSVVTLLAYPSPEYYPYLLNPTLSASVLC